MKSHPASVFYIILPVVALVEKNLPANARNVRDMGLIPGSRRSPGGGYGNPLQYSCLKNPHKQRSLAGYSPWGYKELKKKKKPNQQANQTKNNGQKF